MVNAPEEGPTLPIVDEIGAEFRARARERLAELGRSVESPAPRPPRPTAAPRRRARRVARRVTIVVALMGLIAGVAVAARLSTGGGQGPADTRPTLIARGHGWTLSAFRHEGHLCVELSGDGALAEGCEPAPGRLRATSLLLPGRRLVAGVSGPGVATVTVSVDGRHARRATRAPLDPVAAGAAGLPAGARWYLAGFRGRVTSPARVRAFDRDGEVLGPTLLDCSLGALRRACRRQAQAEAEAALDRSH